MNSFDTTVYHWINSLSGHLPIADDLMKFVAQYALEIYGILFIVAWSVYPRRDTRHRHALVMSVCAGILALLINVVISHIWFRPRPFTVLPKDSFHQLIPHAPDASFPSDHASGSAAFAAGTWGRGPKWLSRTFTIIAVVVMFSRVYVGVHWPTDVLASLAVGIIAGKCIWLLSPWLMPVTRIGLRLFRYGEYAGGKDREGTSR